MKKNGIESIAEALNLMDGPTRDKILANVARENPALAAELARRMFTFNDLLRLESRDIQLLITEISVSKLAIALRGASDELKNYLFKNMSRRAVDLLSDEVQALGPQPLSRVEAEQAEILKVAKRLESEGKILLSPKK